MPSFSSVSRETFWVGDRIRFVSILEEEWIDTRLNPNASAVLSNYFKKQLCIRSIREDDRVEISPLVSYDGHERIE
ncbi:unnamed protein product [Sphagnum balticum]